MATSAAGHAPGRVNLIGEHTDYNAGLCLPLAIPYGTTARVVRRGDDVVRLVSDQQPDAWQGTLDTCGPGAVTGWAAYAAGVLWALRETGRDLPGVEITLESTVPLGAGLSSSASLECAVAVGLVALLDLDLTDDLRRELVEVCIRAEAEVAGAPTGGLDQTASLLTQDAAAVLVDFADGRVHPVALPLAEAGLELLVVDTRVHHTLLDGGYAARRADCEAAAAALGVATLRGADAASVEALDDERLRRRARHVVGENARVERTVDALARRDWTGVGVLLDASHASLRDDFEVSCAELDLAVEVAREAGALGARMTGGGFGGSAVALVPTDRADAVRRAVDVAFARAGHAAPAHLLGTPSPPARVLA